MPNVVETGHVVALNKYVAILSKKDQSCNAKAVWTPSKPLLEIEFPPRMTGTDWTEVEVDVVMFSSSKKTTISVNRGQHFVRLSPPRTPCRFPLGPITSSRIDLGALLRLGSVTDDLLDALSWIMTNRVETILKRSPELQRTREARRHHISRGMLRDAEGCNGLEATGVLAEAKPSDLSIVIPLFKVEKAEAETSRLVADCRPLNELLPRPGEMGLPGIHTVIEQLLRGNLLYQLDARSFFYQFPIHESLQDILLCRLGNERGKFRVMKWLVMAMGLSFAPKVAQQTALQICRLAAPYGGIIPWVDNFLFSTKTPEEMTKLLARFEEVRNQINLELKPTEDKPNTTLDALGLHFDVSADQVEDHFVTMGKDFKAHLLEERGVRSARQLFGAFGALMWAVYTVWRVPLCQFPLIRNRVRDVASAIMSGRQKWDDPLELSSAEQNELSFMRKAAANATWTLKDLGDTEAQEWWTDASDHTLALILGNALATKQTSYESIFASELEAVVAAVVASTSSVVKVNCDNMAVCQAVLKGRSKTPAGDQMLRWMVEHMTAERVQMNWVPSECNVADAPTRGVPFIGVHSLPCQHKKFLGATTWHAYKPPSLGT